MCSSSCGIEGMDPARFSSNRLCAARTFNAATVRAFRVQCRYATRRPGGLYRAAAFLYVPCCRLALREKVVHM